MKYIIKISPELTIKSKPVRKRSILKLKNNIKKHFDFNSIKVIINYSWDRITLETPLNPPSSGGKELQNILKNIPWIAYFMEVETFLLPEDESTIFDFVLEKTKDFYLKQIENKTFVVRVTRSWNHNFSSIDLERYVWWWLLSFSKNSKVQMKNSDIVVKIEVKDKKVHIIKEKIEWIWWYPVWFQNKVLSLISGWFDSWVSTYSMMKRWCEVDYLFFNLWGSAHELWVKQVSYYLWKTFSVPHKRARFLTVNFEEVIAELLTKVNHKFRWVILKRFMLKVASKISEKYYFALVKWDSLWQVSSQTLENMHVIDKASTNLVLRPLISYNKQEIINISKEIWTYNFACNMPEYCWVISDKPTTKASLSDILEQEEKIAESVLEKAIENLKIEFVSDIIEKYSDIESEIELTYLPEKNDIIIDIREEDDIKKRPLKIENNEILNITFFKINNEFEKLDQTKTYLFYCDKWVLSNLHWLYLKEKWFNNIKVFRFLENNSSCKN